MPAPLGQSIAAVGGSSSSQATLASSSSSTATTIDSGPGTFWTCRPGCTNCTLAVAEELFLANEFPKRQLGVFFTQEVDDAAAMAFGTRTTASTNDSPTSSPSVAQVAPARTYLALIGRT